MFTIRWSLETYNALTDTNPDHFALFADQDNILIKEKVRGSISVSGFGSQNIAHGLTYIPLVFVFGNMVGDEWTLLGGDSGNIYAHIELNTTNIVIVNSSSVAHLFKYYLFYDQVA